jgi:hypothetical protein
MLWELLDTADVKYIVNPSYFAAQRVSFVIYLTISTLKIYEGYVVL